MWKKLADGVTKDQLLSVIAQNTEPFDKIHLSWEKHGITHMCSVDVIGDIRDEDLEGVNDFTIWVTEKQFPDKRPNHLKN